MTTDTKFFATVSEEGRLQFSAEERRALDATLRKLAGRPVAVSVKLQRTMRSAQANRYYFGVVVPLIAAHCGYDHQEMHEVLALRFLRIDDCPVTGVPRRKRTPETDSREFSDYVDACIRLAGELGVTIPGPNEVPH